MPWEPELCLGLYLDQEKKELTFWLSTARFRLDKGSVLATVPKKMGLNWFMPALVKSSVGSL